MASSKLGRIWWHKKYTLHILHVCCVYDDRMRAEGAHVSRLSLAIAIADIETWFHRMSIKNIL